MKVNKKPLVSVIMPTHNAGDFLRFAIESILNQTYKNIELIIVNDASTDETSNILNLLKSNRKVRIITNEVQVGVSKSANIGVSKARGEFIARMDSDDIAISTRFEKQVVFLTKNKNVVAVGGQCELIDSSGIKIGEKRFPIDNYHIKSMIFANVPLQQPTLMVNKKLLPNNFLWYDNNFSSAEELELIFRLFNIGEVRNLRDVVLRYRVHDHNTSLIDPKRTFYLTLKTRIKAVFKIRYTPTIRRVLITIAQLGYVTIIPDKWIYPVYVYIRGMRKIDISNAKINLDVFKPLKKVYQLVQS